MRSALFFDFPQRKIPNFDKNKSIYRKSQKNPGKNVKEHNKASSDKYTKIFGAKVA